MNKKIKAIALLSGGLDSIIAARLIKDQGIDVTCIYFSSPLWSSDEKEKDFIDELKKQNDLEIKVVPVGDEYIDIIKNPQYGWGKEINPCVDCKIFMLKKAKKIMEDMKAIFIITGEVVGQRPMSQHISALNYIEKNADARGILVRPLSAKILQPTEPELKGLIDRNRLVNISGRSRKIQNEYARKLNIKTFSSPAGGCLLTQKIYANRLRDMLDHEKNITMRDLELLKYGRHFRFNGSKIIVGRNKDENDILKKFQTKNDALFETEEFPGPVTILLKNHDEDTVRFSAELTLLYSDCPDNIANVRMEKKGSISYLSITKKFTKNDIFKYNLSNC